MAKKAKKNKKKNIKQEETVKPVQGKQIPENTIKKNSEKNSGVPVKEESENSSVREAVVNSPAEAEKKESLPRYEIDSKAMERFSPRPVVFPWKEFFIGLTIGFMLLTVMFIFFLKYSENINTRISELERNAQLLSSSSLSDFQAKVQTDFLIFQHELSSMKNTISSSTLTGKKVDLKKFQNSLSDMQKAFSKYSNALVDLEKKWNVAQEKNSSPEFAEVVEGLDSLKKQWQKEKSQLQETLKEQAENLAKSQTSLQAKIQEQALGLEKLAKNNLRLGNSEAVALLNEKVASLEKQVKDNKSDRGVTLLNEKIASLEKLVQENQNSADVVLLGKKMVSLEKQMEENQSADLTLLNEKISSLEKQLKVQSTNGEKVSSSLLSKLEEKIQELNKRSSALENDAKNKLTNFTELKEQIVLWEKIQGDSLKTNLKEHQELIAQLEKLHQNQINQVKSWKNSSQEQSEKSEARWQEIRQQVSELVKQSKEISETQAKKSAEQKETLLAMQQSNQKIEENVVALEKQYESLPLGQMQERTQEVYAQIEKIRKQMENSSLEQTKFREELNVKATALQKTIDNLPKSSTTSPPKVIEGSGLENTVLRLKADLEFQQQQFKAFQDRVNAANSANEQGGKVKLEDLSEGLKELLKNQTPSANGAHPQVEMGKLEFIFEGKIRSVTQELVFDEPYREMPLVLANGESTDLTVKVNKVSSTVCEIEVIKSMRLPEGAYVISWVSIGKK